MTAPRASKARAALRVLAPFLGLAFITGVFFLYDLVEHVFTGGPVALDKFPRLFPAYNLKLVAAQSTIIGIGALGMTAVIISGGIDLSPGSVIALVTVVIAAALRGVNLPVVGELTLGPAAALFSGLAVGLLAGFLNGLLVTGLRIVPFIVTLGTMSIARGAAKLASGEQKIAAPESWLNGLLYVDPAGPVWKLPQGVVVLAVLACLLGAVLRWSVFGRHVFAIGSNEPTARLCGVRVERVKVFVYTLAGGFAAAAGVMEFSTLGVGDPSTAIGKELDIIAAVVIGGGSLSGGRGSVVGSIVGALIIGLLRNGCVHYDIPNTVQEIVIGGVIIAAVAVDRLRARRR